MTQLTKQKHTKKQKRNKKTKKKKDNGNKPWRGSTWREHAAQIRMSMFIVQICQNEGTQQHRQRGRTAKREREAIANVHVKINEPRLAA